MKMDKTILINQRQFINFAINNKNIKSPLLLGFLGNYSFNLASFFARTITNKTDNNEIFRLAIQEPFSCLAYFFGSIVIVYLIAILFGGQKRFIDYIKVSGFGGIYGIIMSISFTLVTSLSPLVSNTNQPNFIVRIICLIGVLSIIII